MKKLLFIFVFISILSVNAFASEYTLSQTSRISDGSIYSNISLSAGDTIVIDESYPIDALYMVWNEAPTALEIEADGEVVTISENIFLHSFIELSSEAVSVSVTVLSDSVLCYIKPQEAGTVVEGAEYWEPTLTDCDMLIVSTHGDDEYLFFGGTIPLYAGEQGKDVQLIYLTNHGITGEPYRMHEILWGLYSGGVRAYPIFTDFPDYYAGSHEQATLTYGADAFIDLLVETIRATKPEVVIGQDIDGEYGHGVHILGVDNLMDAVPLAADETYGESDIHTVQKLYLHIYPENYIKLDFNIPLDFFDGKTAHEMGAQGYSYHRSQHGWFSYEDYIDAQYDNAVFGLYYSAVGLDTEKTDFFENVKYPPVRTFTEKPKLGANLLGLRKI